MQRVPVVDKNNIPLMPTKASRARRMVRDGKAVGKWSKLGVYYVQLIDEPSGQKTQAIALGNDPGIHFSGIGVQSTKFTLFTAHLFLPFETVKKRMEQRRMMRRNRRGRRIDRSLSFVSRSHRQKRFDNRRQKKVCPSIKSNRLLEIRIITLLAKIYPISSITYEYVKAKTKPGCGFSPIQIGQKWAIEQLSKIGRKVLPAGTRMHSSERATPVTTKLGWETSNLRKHLGLPKQKYSKGDAVPSTHATDGLSLACSQFIRYLPFENSQGRGHSWQGGVQITDALFFVIRRLPISRRQLHLMLPAKGGKRRKYGGTTTRHDIRKGDYVEAEKAGIKYRGWCSGDTAKQISVSNTDYKRVGQFTARKVKLLQRSTGLICKRGNNFSVALS